jgi:hypothetical protein
MDAPLRFGMGRASSHTFTPLTQTLQEASMSKLTAEQKVREYNRGQKAAKNGQSRYWSDPSAYPFESEEHYQGRAEAFDQGYDEQLWHELKREAARSSAI